MAVVRVLSMKTLSHSFTLLLLVMIVDPFSYRLEMISKKSSMVDP